MYRNTPCHIYYSLILQDLHLLYRRGKESSLSQGISRMLFELSEEFGRLVFVFVSYVLFVIRYYHSNFFRKTSSEGKSSSGNSGGSQETGTGQSGQGSSEQSQDNQNSQKNNNINTTKMETNSVLEASKSDIDWNSIKYDIENLNQSWSVILLDLYSLNVSNDDIIAFSKELDNCIISIKNENKIDSLNNIVKLYSYIPIYERAISAENSIQNIKQTKSFLVNAYLFVEQGNWNDVQTNISECEKSFKNVVNDIEFAKKNEYKVNKTYVLVKELQNSLNLQDKEVFYMKYKNLLESINTL